MNRRTLVKLSAALATAQLIHARQAFAEGTPSPVTYAQEEWLASADWLRQHLGDVAVIALTPPEDFAKGHIAGAVQIDWPDLEIVETTDQAIADWQPVFEDRMTALGVVRSDTVLVYDGGTFYAARLWWLLHLLGHADVRILNGGLPGWTESGYATETGAQNTTPAATNYAGVLNDDVIAQIDEVEAALNDPDIRLIDARVADEYVAGHIPGAVNIPFTTNAESELPKYWLPPEELQSLYEGVGITSAQRVIPYCTTGVRSAATYFTLRLLGFENVALFSGSFVEWTSDPSRPVVTGDTP